VDKPEIGDVASFDGVEVDFQRDKLVDMGNGEVGVWNLKKDFGGSIFRGHAKHVKVQVEVDLNKKEDKYLLYSVGHSGRFDGVCVPLTPPHFLHPRPPPQAKFTKGNFFPDAARFDNGGTIYLVNGLPLPWNMRRVGKFTLEHADAPKPQTFRGMW